MLLITYLFKIITLSEKVRRLENNAITTFFQINVKNPVTRSFFLSIWVTSFTLQKLMLQVIFFLKIVLAPKMLSVEKLSKITIMKNGFSVSAQTI